MHTTFNPESTNPIHYPQHLIRVLPHLRPHGGARARAQTRHLLGQAGRASARAGEGGEVQLGGGMVYCCGWCCFVVLRGAGGGVE